MEANEDYLHRDFETREGEGGPANAGDTPDKYTISKMPS
jgi:hypothetical protein